YLTQIVGVGARVLEAVFAETLAEARGQTAREGDDPLGVRGDPLEVDGRLAALQPLQEARRGELDQVAVTGVAGGQQRQVVALDLRARTPSGHRRGGAIGQVYLAADDRLDPV